jgi:TonB family protein
MNIKQILFLWLFASPSWMLAQPWSPREPEPSDFIHLDKEPKPLNVDSLQKALVYPPFAMEAGLEGKVILRVLISESGTYIKHIIVKNPTQMLTVAAEAQVPYVRFEPVTQGGHPAKYWVTIPFDFRLPDPLPD